jgi:dTDP-glucose pyrophosphorylase
MDPNKSKELLLDATGRPIIEWCLKFAPNPLCIIRKEKEDLIEYCKAQCIKYMVVDKTKEWQDSILKSMEYWRNENLLLLPDTRFSPIEAVGAIDTLLGATRQKLVFATHKVQDPHKWGIVDDFHIYEKPKGYEVPMNAWGLIGFTKSIGEELFTSLLNDKCYNIKETYSCIQLKEFKDLTRGNP